MEKLMPKVIELGYIFSGVLLKFHYKLSFFIVCNWCLIFCRVYLYSSCYGPSYASVPVTKTRPAGATGTG